MLVTSFKDEPHVLVTHTLMKIENLSLTDTMLVSCGFGHISRFSIEIHKLCFINPVNLAFDKAIKSLRLYICQISAFEFILSST